ncbi:MAG: FMN-binding negative transcriptional regulator [Anaerolineales bacterium]
MYIPKINAVTDDAVIDDFIKKNDFAIVVSAPSGEANGEPLATHLPLELVTRADGQRLLYGHFAAANPHWRALSAEKPVLAIFSGTHTYISPRWYEHPDVPTWNYMTAHVYGTPRLIEDEAELFAALSRLVTRYEGNSGYTLEGLPPKVSHQIRGVVGFEITVERVEAKFKLSQNRKSTDYANIIAHLRQREDAQSQAVAEAMAALRRD